jgi:hypothetical protein
LKKEIRFYIVIFTSFFLIILFTGKDIIAQDYRNRTLEWSTWILVQAVPSPALFDDRNDNDSRLQFGLRWQVTPFSYCFNTNKLTSPVSFFKVNPLRRHSGSVELLAEPEWTTGGYKYSNLERFSLASGIRGFIPLQEYGEYLSASLALKYNFHKNTAGENKNYPGIEAGIYTFFGMAGLKFNYNFSDETRYNISLNIKYY